MSDEQEPGRDVKGLRDAVVIDPSWGAQQLETDLSIAERTGIVKPPRKNSQQSNTPSISELHARLPHAVDAAPIEAETEDERTEPLSLAERMGFVRRPQVKKVVLNEHSLSHKPIVSNPDEIID